MRQQLHIGTLPADEILPRDMATYKVCCLWRDELKATWLKHMSFKQGSPPCKLLVLSQGHKISDYYEVVAVFDDADSDAAAAAFWFEKHMPKKFSPANAEAFAQLVSNLA